MRTWPNGDPNLVIRQILGQPAYRSVAHTTATAPSPNVFETLWQWFVEHALRPLVAPLGRAIAASHGVGSAIGVALIVAALAGLAFALARLVVAAARSPQAVSGGAFAGQRFERRRSALEWRAAALTAAERGDFRGAIAALFAAALSLLDERAIVAFDAARTPGEYRRAVRRERAVAAAAFDELTERFVHAVYAAETTDARDFAVAQRAFGTFEPALAA